MSEDVTKRPATFMMRENYEKFIVLSDRIGNDAIVLGYRYIRFTVRYESCFIWEQECGERLVWC